MIEDKQPVSIEVLIHIARQAGEAIMQVYAGTIDVVRKEDHSPLTQADLAAHTCIEQGLLALTPTLPVLSEESAALPYSERSQWTHYWLVDPLDGTREFIKRNGEFTVNIALISAGRPVMGVVYAPAMDVLYYADAHGAYKQTGQADAEPIHARKLPGHDLNAGGSNARGLVVAGSRSHSDHRMQAFVHALQQRFGEVSLLSMGSSLKICLVAEGRADVYPRLGLTSEWDTAAAQCVLEQAGGHLVNRQVAGVQSLPLRYNTKESLLNPEFFACGATLHDWNQYLES
ncbi:3'(2'),5'-bisphosphate nucleotidase CysQ [Methylobacillus flagellatus]|uniref:3'(2'),5'-bisphosphate nucleotidase CysQ n=1 Tax=Methylobacillus flagellatus TaxID=405 RepID=UPI00256FB044|nr:3'(2'),5'-bisphosphate nucleotidase CysQ [Methylobacillus flagellatus]